MAKKNKGGKKKQPKEVKDTLPEVDKEYYEIQIGDLNKKLKREKRNMGPKKKGRPPPDPNALTEVDRTFYEIQIEELNRKVARLQTQSEKLEIENEEVKNSLRTLDADRADIISHLKRTLQSKKEEIVELNERITAVEQAKETERNLFLEKIKNMEQDFKQMHEHHISEIKLLNGKLNSLEEFRAQREELMNKFLAQEQAMADQEVRHKQALVEVDKNLSLPKTNFQSATQTRIASTTQSVIRENIAVNNELNILIDSWKKLYDQNEKLKSEMRTMRIENGIDKKEKERTMKRNIIQSQVIDRLAYEHHKLFSKFSEFNQLEKRIVELDRMLDESETEKGDQKIRVMMLLKKLHAQQIETNLSQNEKVKAQTHCHLLEKTALKALKIVKELIGLRKSVVDHIKMTADEEEAWCAQQKALRNALLKNLLELLDNNELFTQPSILDAVKSTTTITDSEWANYALGNLGIIPTAEMEEVSRVIEGIDDMTKDD